MRGTVGDLGCNMGACTILLSQASARIERIFGFDMNKDALDLGASRVASMEIPIPVKFVVASLLDVPVESHTFDFLVSFHTLEHIYPSDATKFASEVFRILKPGGHFLISIPYQHAYPDPAHVAFYNVETLTGLMEGVGLVTIECMEDNRWPNEKDLLTGVFYKPTETTKHLAADTKFDGLKKGFLG
jgi:ubiquinone/menaquinone biosynthesis C-methylase UbiE